MQRPIEDTTALILQARRAQDAARRMAILGTLLLVATPLGAMVWAMAEMLKVGWGAYLRLPAEGIVLDALSACLYNGPCRGGLFKTLGALPVPFWALFAPGVLLLGWALIRYISASHQTPTKLPGAAQFRQNWRKDLTGGISYMGVKEGVQLSYRGDARFKHTFILGSTGAGKTSRVIRPMIATAALEGRSSVVWDLKYPDPALLSSLEIYRQMGYRVMAYLPYEPNSPRIPLLRGAQDPNIARNLAEVIIPVGEKESKATYYINIERQLLATLIYIEAQETGSLGEIARQCQRGFKSLQRHIDSKAQDRAETLGFFFDLADSMKSSMTAGLAGLLSPFNDPMLARSTSFGPIVEGQRQEELDLSILAKEPSLWYLGIPQRYIMGGAGQIFLQLLKRYLDRILLEESERNGGPLKVPVEIYLDEFTNLGYLPYMPDVLSTMRSRRVAYTLALQSFAQGLERYEEEALESILGNCNTWILFGYGLSDVDAERVSRALGKSTVYEMGHSVSTPHLLDFQRMFPSYGQNSRLAESMLLSPEELRGLPEGVGVVRFAAGDPIVADFPRLDQIKKVKGPIAQAARIAQGIDERLKGLERHLRQMGLDEEAVVRGVATYILGDALLQYREDEELAQKKETPPETIFVEWICRELPKAEDYKTHYDPEKRRLTKVSFRPAGGLFPEVAGQWEKMQWIKRERGREIMSLVQDGLRIVEEKAPGLFEGMRVYHQVKAWVEAHQKQIEGHPSYQPGGEPVARLRGNSLLVSAAVLARIGIGEEEVARLGGDRTRVQGRRGYFEIPLTPPATTPVAKEAAGEVESGENADSPELTEGVTGGGAG